MTVFLEPTTSASLLNSSASSMLKPFVTVVEIVSLSDRFGIHLTFYKPDKGVYLDIVHKLAADRGISMDEAMAVGVGFGAAGWKRVPSWL